MILRRIEGSVYSEVVPLWTGLTVVVIACGPSLTPKRVELVRQARVDGRVRCVGVNDAYLFAPWLDLNYAADSKWHGWHTAGIAKPTLGLSAAEVGQRWATFAGQKCSIEWSGSKVADDQVHILRNRDGDVHGMGLSFDPRRIATGRNSGAQATNIAVLSGAKRILLLGIDGGPDREGKTHAHGGHPSPTQPAIWPYVRQSFSAMEDQLTERGIEVLNLSLESQVGAFPKVGVEDALASEIA